MSESRKMGVNRDPIYAPDGTTWYDLALEEAAKRGNLENENDRLRAALEWIDRRDEVGQYIRDKIHEALSPQWGKPI